QNDLSLCHPRNFPSFERRVQGQIFPDRRQPSNTGIRSKALNCSTISERSLKCVDGAHRCQTTKHKTNWAGWKYWSATSRKNSSTIQLSTNAWNVVWKSFSKSDR